ncbi:MAG: alpha/beta hydrolase [Clostridia bacterium]|nr:alpha/beta hydrolase [Clostridia bacterium]
MKYPIDREFKKIAWFKTPLNRALLPFSTFLLRMVSAWLLIYWRRLKVKRQRVKSPEWGNFTVLILSPKAETKKLPCLVYLHGGGFVFDASFCHYDLAARYALKTPCKVVFVRYKLAPKHPYPYAPEQCLASYLWARENAEKLNIDPDRIAIGGDSAGGTLTASVALMLRDRKLPLPCALMMIYPFFDGSLSSESIKKYTDTPMCNTPLLKKMLRFYLNGQDIKDCPYASPIDCKDLHELPPSYIETAEFDCLHDDGAAFAKHLSEVTLHETHGTIHGYDAVLGGEIVTDSINRRLAFLKKHFNIEDSEDENERMG